VYGVFVLETVQTALSGADLYHWFAAGFGKPDYLLSPYLSFVDVPIMGSVISLIVQYFFVYRIWALSSKRWWWLCIIIFICLVNLFLKSENNLITLPVALNSRCIRGIHGWDLRESPPFRISQNMSQL